jgi:outer membrane protein, heavy metal efflux system
LQAMGEGAGRSAGAGGARELEAGVAWPLWRPGEQARAQQLASAGLQRSQARTLAEHWQLAGSLREAWWAVWRAQADRQAAQARVQGLRALQADVARRVAAGDLARADGHQAAMAVAQAEAGLAEAQARHDGALSSLLALTGGEMASVQPWLDAPVGPEPGMPPAPATPSGAESDAPAWQAVPEAHPAHALARAQSAEAAAQAEWQAVAADAPPELTLSGTRGREGLGEAERQTFTVGLRWPLGEAGEAPARRHQAHAERLEAEAAERHTVARLQAELTGARARWQAMAAHWQATQHQARLARESLGFWTRAFEWGQADLPTRLRAEQELHQADAALARARIEWWAAWSSWRQALGLLP